MPTIHVEAELSRDDLIKAVDQLDSDELNRFVSQVLILLTRRGDRLRSVSEFPLLLRISQDLPKELGQRYRELMAKRDAALLGQEELDELAIASAIRPRLSKPIVSRLSPTWLAPEVFRLLSSCLIWASRRHQMASEHIPLPLRRAVRLRAGGLCEYCHSQARFAMQPFSIEHIVPRSQQGTATLENLAVSCQGCNNHKYQKIFSEDPATGSQVALFHPRRDNWQEHFTWNEDASLVIGLTPTGRATVLALQLNREGLVNLRKILFAAGDTLCQRGCLIGNCPLNQRLRWLSLGLPAVGNGLSHCSFMGCLG